MILLKQSLVEHVATEKMFAVIQTSVSSAVPAAVPPAQFASGVCGEQLLAVLCNIKRTCGASPLVGTIRRSRIDWSSVSACSGPQGVCHGLSTAEITRNISAEVKSIHLMSRTMQLPTKLSRLATEARLQG